MLQIVIATFFFILRLPLEAQTAASGQQTPGPVIPAVFAFDDDASGSRVPTGWGGGPAGTVFVDDSISHSGHNSVRLERNAKSARDFSTVTNGIQLTYSGETIQLRGFLRTESVSGFVGLWMNEDQDGTAVAFENMQSKQLKGTTGWTEYSIELPLKAGAQSLSFGVLLSGTGKAWVDDLRLLVDGKPISAAPHKQLTLTVLDRDHQFDGGSGISVKDLTPLQIENLSLLGEVWGFLKYYHPAVTAGEKHWDYELFRIAPAVLAAADRTTAQDVISKWVEGQGPVKPCEPCVSQDAEVELRPSLGWIRDEQQLGSQLSRVLVGIEHNRVAKQQFYVSLTPNVRNPSFDHELAYGQIKFPDAGFQLLAVYRFWNIIEYWSPYRDLVGEDWGGVLREFIPRIVLAKDKDEYQRQLMALIAEAHDTHANLWSSLQLRPPGGSCRLPVNLRFVPDRHGKNRAVIASFASPDGSAMGAKVGDLVDAIDGVPVSRLIEKWSPYYADSNDAARLRDISRSMTNGECVDVKLTVRRGKEELLVTTKRLPAKDMKAISYTHDLPGDTFRLLSPDVGYLKLSSVKIADVHHYLEVAAKTKGLIIDIRNYPSEFVVFALGSHLIEKPTAFARFTNGDLSTPGAFHWTESEMLQPAGVSYAGKVVILVDEDSQSQAEYTAMAFRASPHAVVVGSTTAGADGNVSDFSLPGGLSSMISGIGVFYPDRRPTQQIGIIVDRKVNSTIEGIRAGRDEVLEEGVRQILGQATNLSTIDSMIAGH